MKKIIFGFMGMLLLSNTSFAANTHCRNFGLKDLIIAGPKNFMLAEGDDLTLYNTKKREEVNDAKLRILKVILFDAEKRSNEGEPGMRGRARDFLVKTYVAKISLKTRKTGLFSTNGTSPGSFSRVVTALCTNVRTIH